MGRRATILLLLLLANSLFLLVSGQRYRSIVVHHSAFTSGDFRDIRSMHRKRGWFETAYHLVLSNGSTEIPRGHLEPTWCYLLGTWSTATGSRRHNLQALHLCVVGNYEAGQLPTDLARALGHALRALQERHGIADSEILLHRDCSPTACPGQNIDRSRLLAWAAEAERAPAELRRQHLSATRRARLPTVLYWAIWAVAHLLLLRWALAARRSRAPPTPGLEGEMPARL